MSPDDVDSDKENNHSRTSASNAVDISSKRKEKPRRTKREWEIVEGLRDGQRYEEKPSKVDGYLSKRRNPPLKGWHRRYFVLEAGMVTYSKTPLLLQKGKVHGSLDVGTSVLSINRKNRKIDLDTDNFVCHLKAKTAQWFEEWIDALRRHRLYRQNELSYGLKHAPLLVEMMTEMTEAALIQDVAADSRCSTSAALSLAASSSAAAAASPLPGESLGAAAEEKRRRYGLLRENSQLRSGSLVASHGRVIAWLIDTSSNEQYSRDLDTVHKTLDDIAAIFLKLPVLLDNSSAPIIVEETPKKSGGFTRKLSFKSGKKSNRKANEQAVGKNMAGSTPSLASSAADLVAYEQQNGGSSGGEGCSDNDPSAACPPPATAALLDKRQDLKLCNAAFLSKSREVLETLKNLARRLNTERERLKAVIENRDQTAWSGMGASDVPSDDVNELKQALAQALKRNEELRTDLALLRNEPPCAPGSAAALAEPPLVKSDCANARPCLFSTHHSELAKSCSLDSRTTPSEYYDAIDEAEGVSNGSSSEASESETSTSSTEQDEQEIETSEDVAASEVDGAALSSVARRLTMSARCSTGRRSKLPAPMSTTGDVSLVQLLTRNIGKDLTRISMPVTLNEPLNALQLLCEELEYSELLDKASSFRDPYERMVYVAAFATSAYSSSVKRAGQKPFNPVLGETYECVRDGMGWRFVAEQVSHHPPISACYTESANFTYWQDIRVKTKFWGKSMEFHPSGTIHLVLKKHNEHYQWNKVTTCLHNIFSGQRWVDQYGEMVIKNVAQGITCKLTFIKASYWSDKRHEVSGIVCASEGTVVRYLHGRWTEGLYCGTDSAARCIWRPGSFPEDYELYYGFTRFAIELNELLASEAPKLPPTDTRFRPDQRCLEEGKIAEAEAEKLRIERLQRDSKKERDQNGAVYQPRWFRRQTVDGVEQFCYGNDYWKCRENPGFCGMSFEPLW